MKTGTKVRVIKEFSKGVVDFEVGDILTVANYIHKQAVFLKADGVIDLIRISSSIMNDYIKEVEIVNAKELKQIVTECLERVYSSDGMIESAKSEVMNAIDAFEENCRNVIVS